jgi:hypothetical protein
MIRRNILILAIIAIAVTGKSQDLPAYSENRNELNLGYFNAFELNGIGDLGIGYKHACEKGAFRIGIGTDLGTYKSDRETYQTKNSGYTLSPRIGYEFHQWYNRIRLHYGADLTTSFSKYTYENIYDDPANNRSIETKSYAAGLRPVLGLTFYINKTISISTETYMDISYSKTTDEELYNENISTEVSHGMRVELGPLGIVSVNFHF